MAPPLPQAVALAFVAGASAAVLWYYLSKARREEGKPWRKHSVAPPGREAYCTGPVSTAEDATVRIVCYGDSNTWGYDSFSAAQSPPALLHRFGEGVRWPRVLAARLGAGFAVVEEGLNGRTTAWDDALQADYCANGRTTLAAILHSHKPVDVIILMLGTNDLKQHFSLSATQISRAAGFVARDCNRMAISRTADRPRVLLVSPPIVWDKPEWAFVDARRRARLCAALYAAEAKALDVDFFDAACVAIPDPKHDGDGIHLSPQNCADLGAALAAKILEMLA
ncbi:SGNH hydrolase-type esterase domain-containing protein [Pelagophyceae sp. CCMP2097]|nr:SGNH hydrolase-type esterase domain-containing protein [Pelagophyceae sp. CCMP2097]|mmetsp:Transcript_4658/g.16622  ORF Transcript_4658/g.16622 Transcript_4658/m.16622 type:complete len:281 (+) Transcript_4658:100-942(+)